MKPRVSAIVALLFSGAILAGQTTPQLKKVPITATSAASGKDMFQQYCASCHGKDGKGNGPAAVALKTTPTNLATLSARNNGTFPELRIHMSIQGDGANSAHGSKEMPVWGEVFHTNENSATVKLRIVNLTEYIKSLQAK